jgi:hypothetical protein
MLRQAIDRTERHPRAGGVPALARKCHKSQVFALAVDLDHADFERVIGVSAIASWRAKNNI